jgi:DNA-binding SARP family transcriptional activator
MYLELADLALATRADGSSSALAPRDAALLAWLALEGPTPRAQLAALLWPDSDPVAARNTLRQRLFHLKRHCGELVVGAAALRLADGVEHDLADAEGVLGALRFPDAPALESWLVGQRERRVCATRRALELQVRALEDAGELAAALTAAQALLRLDRLSEAAHRHVMRLHYLLGDRAAALLAFDACERALKDDVGTRPSADTMALLHTIELALPHTWIPGQPLPASALRPPQLIGRAAELGDLARAWAAQRLFVVTGEAGAGKSRLLDAMAERTPGAMVLRARPGDDKVPLATLARLVHRLGDRWPTIVTMPACARLVALMAGPGAGRAPTVQSVAPLLVDLLRAACAQGLVGVVLDDLQFADDASVDTWQELLVWPALAALRFGFASRVDGDSAAARVASLGARSDVVVLALQPLVDAALLPFVESLGLPLGDAGAVAAALARCIGGNPLHLLETIRHALEKHGHLSADNLEAPARVTELLEQRLLALPADSLLLVRIAAVAGSDFEPELAAAVSGRDVLELADAWQALERHGLLDARGFVHDLIGEAAHRRLPQPIARVLHARVAAWLEQRGASPARLAHHLLCAGEDGAAVPHLTGAARQAWQLGRSREMRNAYGKAAAIELARGRRDAAFDLLFDRAEAITELGPAEAFMDAVESLAPLAHTPSQEARLAFLRAVGFHLRADHAGCLARLGDVLALAIASGDRAIEAGCRYTLGYYAAHDGRLHEAIEHLAATVTLLRGVGRAPRALVIELSVHGVLLWTGQAKLALDRQRDALQRVLDSGSSNMLATVMIRQADSELRLGDIAAAMRSAGRALAALRATDMIGGDLAATARAIAGVQRRCGHWSDALDIVDETRERLGPNADPDQWLAQALADIYLDLGRPDLAHRQIEAFAAASRHSVRLRQRALALRWNYSFAVGAGVDAAAAVERVLRSENLLQACKLVLVAGRAAEPELTAAQCAALIARCEPEGLREQLAPLHALCARLLAREGDARLAMASVAQAEHALRQGDIGAVTPLVSLWLALALQRLDRAADGALHARQASAWLADRALHAVPPEFRDSFLHRNPVHAALLAWTAGVNAAHG